MEVTGKEEAAKLADSVRSVVGEMARVSRPSRKTPVLILGIPDWLEEEEVRKEIVEAERELASVEISIRQNDGGGRIASFAAPMETAVRLAERRSIRIGWGLCRVKLIERRHPVCFRCQERGHLAMKCRAQEVAKKCFRCRQTGHLAATCPGPPFTGRKDSELEGGGQNESTRPSPND
ncbi:uncharacterized protein LOC112598375 [Melanaphis sacchari]|uniref:uncharacterized protein LOC112598375 n=1 Tax=Melanaphis sacchari TaxID=742174 RepID=UPI000DC14F4B|nr:uncharacterized protein LOC112598375 [Melanaphis sacchari]